MWVLFTLVYGPSVLANVQVLTGPAGSADVLPTKSSVQAQFWAAATFPVLQVAAAAAAITLLPLSSSLAPNRLQGRARLDLRWSDGRRPVVGGAGGGRRR